MVSSRFLLVCLVALLQQTLGQLSVELGQRLAFLNSVAYCKPEQIAAWQCQGCDQSFTKPTVIEREDGEATMLVYITDDQEDTIYVVAKGTEPTDLQAWAKNLNFLKEPFLTEACPECEVHAGFLDQYNAVFEDVVAALQQYRERLPNARIYMVGHSLGGAVISLLAAQLATDYPDLTPDQVYTMGSPRPGNDAFRDYVNGLLPSRVIRLVEGRDIVTDLPLEATNFHHVGVYYNCRDTKCSKNGLSFRNLLDKFVGWVKEVDPLHDHSHYMGHDFSGFIPFLDGSKCSA